MKINSLDEFDPSTRGFVAVLDSSEHKLSFPAGLDEVSFYFAKAAESIPREERCVLVDIDCDLMDKMLQALVVNEDDAVEYWCPRFAINKLKAIIALPDNYAINGLHTDLSWIYVEISPSRPESRGARDFLRGLEIPETATAEEKDLIGTSFQEKVTNEVAPPEYQISWRSEFINWMLPHAKRIKPFLPRRVIVSLYKLVNRFR